MSRGKRKGFSKKGSGTSKTLAGGRRYVTGRHVLEELLEHAPERIERVFIVEGASTAKGEGARRRDLIEKLGRQGKHVEYLSSDELSVLVGTASHQGFAAIVRERHFPDLSDFLEDVDESHKSLVLLLDDISDPQNLGTILRAAECFGVDAVIWSKNRGVDLTPVVSKTSVGASELVPIIRVANLAEAARKLKEVGYWVVSSIIDENAQPLDAFDAPRKVALIIGSEGEGIGRLLVEVSDFTIYIPLTGAIQSLNVSQATAVLLYELRKKLSRMD